MPGAWLILPTFNEAKNIEAIVLTSLEQLATTGLEHTILIVDDSSPDGTGEIADRLAGEHPQVRVMHRPLKQGLGRAYLAGFLSEVLLLGVPMEDGSLSLLEPSRRPAALGARVY